MHPPIKGIIFDFDGTLITSVDILLEYFLKVGNQHGGKVIADDFHRVNGMLIGDAIKVFLKEKKLTYRGVLMMLMRRRKVKRAVWENVELYPHALECLAGLQEHFQLAIATSGPRYHVEHFVRKFGLQDYFETIVSQDDVKQKKPYPEAYLKAAKQLGFPPENCLSVEDSPIGVLAAKRAGVQSCVVLHTSPQRFFPDDRKPDFFIPDLSLLTPENLQNLKALSI